MEVKRLPLEQCDFSSPTHPVASNALPKSALEGWDTHTQRFESYGASGRRKRINPIGWADVCLCTIECYPQTFLTCKINIDLSIQLLLTIRVC